MEFLKSVKKINTEVKQQMLNEAYFKENQTARDLYLEELKDRQEFNILSDVEKEA